MQNKTGSNVLSKQLQGRNFGMHMPLVEQIIYSVESVQNEYKIQYKKVEPKKSFSLIPAGTISLIFWCMVLFSHEQITTNTDLVVLIGVNLYLILGTYLIQYMLYVLKVRRHQKVWLGQGVQVYLQYLKAKTELFFSSSNEKNVEGLNLDKNKIIGISEALDRLGVQLIEIDFMFYNYKHLGYKSEKIPTSRNSQQEQCKVFLNAYLTT